MKNKEAINKTIALFLGAEEFEKGKTGLPFRVAVPTKEGFIRETISWSDVNKDFTESLKPLETVWRQILIEPVFEFDSDGWFCKAYYWGYEIECFEKELCQSGAALTYNAINIYKKEVLNEI